MTATDFWMEALLGLPRWVLNHQYNAPTIASSGQRLATPVLVGAVLIVLLAWFRSGSNPASRVSDQHEVQPRTDSEHRDPSRAPY